MCGVTETSAQRPAIDFSSFDQSIRIQDDLFRHVNGSWLNTTEIPADKPLTGAFMNLRDQAEAAVRDIITTLEGGEPGSDEAKIADLYASFMDEEAVENAGSTPITAAAGRDRFRTDTAGADADGGWLRASGGARTGVASGRARSG